uniref:Bee-milk protein n=1 Tax=Clastoptera arizonana TaxID=38151 RepID=A0A1B6D1S7_9HEMI
MYLFVILLNCFVVAHTWNLSSFELDFNVVNHVNVVRNRAILSVPRVSESQRVTLLEAPWPEKTSRIRQVTAFPRNTIQPIDDCTSVQSAVSSDDDTKGRLYVLDQGFNNCEPKIIVYDLRNNKKISDTTLSGILPNQLHTIIIDTASPYGTRAYIGDAGDSSLIIYNANNRHWWKAELSPPPGLKLINVPSYDMVISALKNQPKLYLTSFDSDKLFSLSLIDLRNFEGPVAIYCDKPDFNAITLSITTEGSKLGRSVGLTVDVRNGVYYYLPSDYACMRWDSRQPMRAESHDVVLQSADKLPDVKQIFTDSQNQMWVLLGATNTDGFHCLLLRRPNYLPIIYS